MDSDSAISTPNNTPASPVNASAMLIGKPSGRQIKTYIVPPHSKAKNQPKVTIFVQNG